MTVTPMPDHVVGSYRLDDLRDLTAAVARTRRLFDLDADPESVNATLSADAMLAPLVARRPGLRVPGHPDGAELVTRAIVGQQISVTGAATIAGRITAASANRWTQRWAPSRTASPTRRRSRP